LHRGTTPGHMRLPHRLQGQKSRSAGAGAYCGGHLAAQLVMDALQDTSEKYNMRINTNKTKIMRMSTVEGIMKIKVNKQNLEKVKQFCYLGSLVTEDCRSCHDVRRRIALGKEAFNKKSDLMRGSLSLHLKKCMVKAFVWSVALYVSETWTLQKEDIRRL